MNEFKLNNNKTLKIIQDIRLESPRNDDNLGTIYHWHKRSNLGDIDISNEGPLIKTDYVDDDIKTEVLKQLA